MKGGAKKERLVDRVAGDVGRRIVSGYWQPGDVLATEAEIGRLMGVSHSVVREAMKVLHAKGLVESRQRRGTTVREQRDWNLLDRDILSWFDVTGPSPEFVWSVHEMRTIFEPAAAALAATHADTAVIAKIEEAYLDMVRTVDDVEVSIGCDAAFHKAILEATRNKLLRSLGDLLDVALKQVFRVSSSHGRGLRETLPDHKKVLAAIQARRPESARRAMRVLLGTTGDRLEQFIGAPPATTYRSDRAIPSLQEASALMRSARQ